ncbi:TPA: hypothetical protein U2T46_002991 [Burkholderia cenocepacia]|nr:hypothetical protein [Burkholderia cenocepacia]
MLNRIFKNNEAKQAAADAAAAIPEDFTPPQVFHIEHAGVKREFRFEQFAALEGYLIAEDFEPCFLIDADRETRQSYLLRVLSCASVEDGKGNFTRLDSASNIDRLCGVWKNVEYLFHRALEFNQIDETKIEKQKLEAWEQAGQKFAVSFAASMVRFTDPLFEVTGKQIQEKE